MSATTPAPVTRKSGEERRYEIAAAALHIIGIEGIKALTAARLADEIGVTPGALYRHFNSLDEVLEATVEHAVALVEASLPSSELPPMERLLRTTLGRVSLIRSTPGLAWLLLSDQVRHAVPEAAVQRLDQLVARSRVFLRDAVLAAQAEGSLRPDLSVPVVLTVLSGTVHALARTPGVHAMTSDTPPEASEVLSSLLHLLSSPPSGEHA